MVSYRNIKLLLLSGTLLLLFVITAGCYQQSSKDNGLNVFGPMAVIDSPGTVIHDARGGEGIVKISKRCIELQLSEGSKEQLNLIWHSGTAKWNAREKAVEFTPLGGNTSLIRNGDKIEVGGKALVNIKKAKWLKKPDKSCQGHRWIVDSVERAGTR